MAKAKQWQHSLHTTSAEAKSALSGATVDGGKKALIEASKAAAQLLLDAGAAGDGPLEVYLDGKPGVWAIVKVAARGDEPDSDG